MQRVSNAYREEMKQPILTSPYELDCLLEVINLEAQEEARLQRELLEYYSNDEHIVFENCNVTSPYAGCEVQLSRVDGSYYFLPKEEEKDQCFYQGAVGSILSDAQGFVNQVFPIKFENNKTMNVKGLCIHFTHAIPIELSIEDDDGTELKRYINDQMIFKTNDVFTFHHGMKLHIHRLDHVYTRCRFEYLEFGMYVALTNENIISMEYHQQIHPLSNSCYIGDMSITCINVNQEYNTENPSSVINFLEKLQDLKVRVSYPLSNGKETIPLASLYLNEWSSSETEVKFKAVDLFSFLESTYYQKKYQPGKDAYTLCEEVLQAASISEYKIDSSLHQITIDNPLPIGTHKEVLQLLCNASKSVFYQDRNGVVVIQPSLISPKAQDLYKEDMLELTIGTKLEQVKKLEISYLQFHKGKDLEEVSKGNYTKGEVLIEFQDAFTDFQVENEHMARINEYGPHFALVEILQEGEVLLLGRKYQESKQRNVYVLNERGVIKTIDHPLLSTTQMVDDYAQWVIPYIMSDRSYEATIRGGMELDLLDVLGIENEYNPNLQIQMDDCTLSFSGPLKSKLSGRKVIR